MEPKRVYIFLDGLNIKHVRALIQVVRCFAHKKIVWKTFGVRVAHVGSYEILCEFLQVVHSLNIAEKTIIRQGQIPPEIRDVERPFLLCGISDNTQVKSLVMDTCLTRYSLGDIHILSQLLQQTTRLEELSLRLGQQNDVDSICAGLQANTSLKTLVLDLNGVLTAGVLIAILTAIQKHPSLTTLKIDGDEYELESLVAIGKYLYGNTATTLRNLEIRCNRDDFIAHAAPVARGLANNQHLQKFHLEGFALHRNGFQTAGNLAALFQAAARGPAMKHVALLFRGITAKDLKGIQDIERLDHAVRLELFPKKDETTATSTPACCDKPAIHRMLVAQPEIRFIDIDDDNGNLKKLEKGNTEFKHICNMNYFGRYLLDRPRIPVAIWPHVLKRVTDDHPSVVFELLKGPAFCARESYAPP